jgi:hypothetical protein
MLLPPACPEPLLSATLAAAGSGGAPWLTIAPSIISRAFHMAV